MKAIEKRNLKSTAVEVRALEDNGKKYITGIIPYNSKSQRMYLGYSDCEYEMLSPTVFNKTLADNAEVYANYAHNDEHILGNTKPGTLTLTNSEAGLICRCEVPNTPWGQEAYGTIEAGNCNTLSFEFIPYDWEEQGDTCVLRSAKLTAVSFCVINPAYTATDSFAEIRSLIKNNKEKREMNNEDIEELKGLIEELKKLLPAESKEEPKEEVQENACDKEEQEKRDESDPESDPEPSGNEGDGDGDGGDSGDGDDSGDSEPDDPQGQPEDTSAGSSDDDIAETIKKLKKQIADQLKIAISFEESKQK